MEELFSEDTDHNLLVKKLVHNEHGKLVTDSRIVAETYEREHKHVLVTIRNIFEMNPKFAESNFQLCYYTSAKTFRKYPYYQMTRDGYKMVSMSFTGKKAAKIKELLLPIINNPNKTLDMSATKQKLSEIKLEEEQIIKEQKAKERYNGSKFSEINNPAKPTPKNERGINNPAKPTPKNERGIIERYKADHLEWSFIDCQNKGNGIPDFCLLKNGFYKWVEFKYDTKLEFSLSLFQKSQILTILEMLEESINVSVVIGNNETYIEIDNEMLEANFQEIKDSLGWHKEHKQIMQNLQQYLAAEDRTGKSAQLTGHTIMNFCQINNRP